MDDYEIEDGPCSHCGNPILHVQGCNVIGCEDGYIDEYEEDPINNDPGDESVCQECHGTGFVRWCPACGKSRCSPEIPKHEYEPCPFCGSENIDEDEDFGMFFCRACGYGMNYEGCDNALQRSEVRAHWNSRPIEDALRTENERLHRYADEQIRAYRDAHDREAERANRAETENERLRGLLRDVLPIVDWTVREYHVGSHPLLEQIKTTLGV